MTASDRPGCPKWCVTDHGTYPSHESAYTAIVREGDTRIAFSAYAYATGHSPDTHVALHGSALGGMHCSLWIDDTGDATHMAALLDLLADATPDEHRALAAQIRAAATALEEAGQ